MSFPLEVILIQEKNVLLIFENHDLRSGTSSTSRALLFMHEYRINDLKIIQVTFPVGLKRNIAPIPPRLASWFPSSVCADMTSSLAPEIVVNSSR